MSEIEIGEWVRTEEGYILKNAEMNHGYIIKDLIKKDSDTISSFGKIVKHSKNIIDLIEKGDFVNGYRITNIILETDLETNKEKIHLYTRREDIKIKNLVIGNEGPSFEIGTKYEPIRTILTHEMYENNCYEVEES